MGSIAGVPMTRATLALLPVLVALGCATGRPAAPRAEPEPRAPAYVRVKTGPQGGIRRVPIEEYVRGAVLSELAPGADAADIVARAFEVQAIVARTYAVTHLGRHQREGYDLCSTTHCQLYEPQRLRSSRWSGAAAEAVRRTAGTVLWFGGTPASALFHADCGGHTSAAGDVWGSSAHPYLQAVDDGGPARTAHTRWRFEVPIERLVAALNADERTSVGRALVEVVVMRRDTGGRAALLLLNGSRAPVVRGEEFRAVVTRAFGPQALRSTRFEVRRTGTALVFTGEGYGHGVGLCQAGALARLRSGAQPRQVLGLYYPGTTLRVLR
jgi:stage II sporulation protein D